MKHTPSFSFVIRVMVALAIVGQSTAIAQVFDTSPAISITEKVKRESTPAEPIVSPIKVPDLDFGGTGLDQKSLNNALFLLQIQQDLKEAYKEYHELTGSISDTKAKVWAVKDTIGTLREQIISFQREIDLSSEKIRNVAEQIGLRERELSLLQDEITVRAAALDNQKLLLGDYMRLLYIRENRFSSDNDQESFSSAKLLLADANIGDTLQEMNTLDMLQHSGQMMLESLSASQAAITEMQSLMLEKKVKLDQLRDRLLAERENLQDQQVAKAKLLEVTHGEQETYEKLIAESEKQEDEALLQIVALQDNFNYIRDNLGRLGNSVSGSNLQKLLDERTRQIYEFQQQQDDGVLFQWPVKPARGISAYFRDEAYKARFGIGHNAIDIPVSQSSQVRAPKDAIVYKTRDNGMGYSYIILSHKDKIMTVYGHMSSILVKEGQAVTAGEVIGLSGGMPGTKGAGYLTTGPHLHFEVLKNGKHVDPMDYLSLTKLPLNSLPAKYVRRVEEQRALERAHQEDTVNVENGGVPEATPEEIDAAVEQSGRDEIETYRRLFGIPKDSASMNP